MDGRTARHEKLPAAQLVSLESRRTRVMMAGMGIKAQDNMCGYPMQKGGASIHTQ